MDGFSVALIFGILILLSAVMFLAVKIQKLHRHARHLRYLVEKLEGHGEAPHAEEGKKESELRPEMQPVTKDDDTMDHLGGAD